jgi:hypothetical protein
MGVLGWEPKRPSIAGRLRKREEEGEGEGEGERSVAARLGEG